MGTGMMRQAQIRELLLLVEVVDLTMVIHVMEMEEMLVAQKEIQLQVIVNHIILVLVLKMVALILQGKLVVEHQVQKEQVARIKKVTHVGEVVAIMEVEVVSDHQEEAPVTLMEHKTDSQKKE